MNLELLGEVLWACIVGNGRSGPTGLALTLLLTLLPLVLGFALALGLALLRLSGSAWARVPAYGFGFFFRGTPLLVQLFIVYFGLAQFDWLRGSLLWKPVFAQALWCAVIVLTLNTGAYGAEILRAGLLAVPRGAIEAAAACGMSRRLAFRRIVLPLAFRQALPAYGNEAILLLHGTALVATITLMDVMGIARQFQQKTYDALTCFVAAAIVYVVLVSAMTLGVKLWEKRLALSPGRAPPLAG